MYQTSDFALTAALTTVGYQINNTRSDGRVCWFVFDDEQPDFIKTVDDYFNNNLSVSALEYQGNLKDVKALVFKELDQDKFLRR